MSDDDVLPDIPITSKSPVVSSDSDSDEGYKKSLEIVSKYNKKRAREKRRSSISPSYKRLHFEATKDHSILDVPSDDDDDLPDFICEVGHKNPVSSSGSDFSSFNIKDNDNIRSNSKECVVTGSSYKESDVGGSSSKRKSDVIGSSSKEKDGNHSSIIEIHQDKSNPSIVEIKSPNPPVITINNFYTSGWHSNPNSANDNAPIIVISPTKNDHSSPIELISHFKPLTEIPVNTAYSRGRGSNLTNKKGKARKKQPRKPLSKPSKPSSSSGGGWGYNTTNRDIVSWFSVGLEPPDKWKNPNIDKVIILMCFCYVNDSIFSILCYFRQSYF